MDGRPNVVVIVSDTFRSDHLGAYGNPQIQTPNLDAFARSSVVFEGHRVSSFPTMPARADILTGTLAYTFMGWEPLPKHLPTLPGLLSGAGYRTMGVVDTPYFIRGGFNYDRGFDDFIWVRGQGDDTRPSERSDYRRTWREESDRLVAKTVTEAEKWLERHHKDEEPFFLYVDTWDPHEPWDAPEYYTEKYRPGYGGRQLYPAYAKYEEAGLTEDDVALAHATYCGEVTMVDFWMGRLLAKLDALNLTDDTMVFFVSDHGFYFGEHGYFGKAEWINDNQARASEDAELPGWLADSWLLSVAPSPLYRELTNIPLIARVPGRGARSSPGADDQLRPRADGPRSPRPPGSSDDAGVVFCGRDQRRSGGASAVRRKLLAALLRRGRVHERDRRQHPAHRQLHAPHRYHPGAVPHPGRPGPPTGTLRPHARPGGADRCVGLELRRGRRVGRGGDLFPGTPGDPGEILTTPSNGPRRVRGIRHPEGAHSPGSRALGGRK